MQYLVFAANSRSKALALIGILGIAAKTLRLYVQLLLWCALALHGANTWAFRMYTDWTKGLKAHLV